MYQTRTRVVRSINFSTSSHSHLIVPLTWFCHCPSARLVAGWALPLQLLWEPWHALNRAKFGMCCSCLAHWCQGWAISIPLSQKAGIQGVKVTSACSSSAPLCSEHSDQRGSVHWRGRHKLYGLFIATNPLVNAGITPDLPAFPAAWKSAVSWVSHSSLSPLLWREQPSPVQGSCAGVPAVLSSLLPAGFSAKEGQLCRDPCSGQERVQHHTQDTPGRDNPSPGTPWAGGLQNLLQNGSNLAIKLRAV